MMNKELQFTCSLGRGRLLVRVYGEVTEAPSSSRKHIRYQVDINHQVETQEAYIHIHHHKPKDEALI